MSGVNYGYVRVSTGRQDMGRDAQRRALETAGCAKIVEEQASGRKAWPALAALVDRLAPGDVMTVFRFDRISRSVADFYTRVPGQSPFPADAAGPAARPRHRPGVRVDVVGRV